MAENGGNHAAGMAGNGAAEENGGVPDPAPAEVAANGGGNAAVVQAGAVFLDLSLFPEAVIYQFFIRMPAAMVARGRAVCRMWRDLTSTEAFRRDHHFHRSLRPTQLFFYGLEHQAVPRDDHVRVHLRAADIRRRESLPVLRFAHLDPALVPFVDPRVFQIQGSCDGILLLSYDTRLYACNPCTRRWARLQPIHRVGAIVGFYARDLGGQREYRMLYQIGLNDVACTYCILSLPEQPARFIGRGRSTNLEAKPVLAGGIRPFYQMPPIEVRERLHWLPRFYHPDNTYVLVFDTADEMFSLIRPPRVLEDDRWVQIQGDQLLEINGRLAMVVVAPTVVRVWVLQDYIGQVWTYDYQIQLPVAEIQANQLGYEEPELSALVFAVSQDRTVLVQCTHALLQCDADGTLLETYQLPAHCTILSGYMLQESLLLHAFLPLRQSDAQDGDPPFFQAP